MNKDQPDSQPTNRIDTKIETFFFNRQNIINQQVRARSTNKLGWKKEHTRENRLSHNQRLKQKPLKNHP